MFSRATPPSPTAGTPRQRQALQLAGQINTLLLRELDQGVDPGRLLADPPYARDVLLVCDAYTGSELPALAQQFRAALQPPAAGPSAARPGTVRFTNGASAAPARRPQPAADSSQDGGRDSSGFGVSRLFHSLFGPLVNGEGSEGSRGPVRAARSRADRDRGSR